MLALLFALQLAAAPARPVADLSAELAQRARDAGLPAVQAAVIDHAGLVAHGAAGVTVLNGSAAVTTGDAFHIGSCTKPFTATIAGLLVEEKKLRWDTKIADVFPEWKQTMRAEYRDVTLADLLSHEAGLAGYGEDEEVKALPPFTGNATERRRAFARYVLEHPPAIAPRTAFQYSNAGYSVAAAMIERVSGRSWEELGRPTSAPCAARRRSSPPKPPPRCTRAARRPASASALPPSPVSRTLPRTAAAPTRS